MSYIGIAHTKQTFEENDPPPPQTVLDPIDKTLLHWKTNEFSSVYII